MIDTDQNVDMFGLFGENRCGFFFRDLKVRNDFNSAFTILKRSGRYLSIYARYVGSHDLVFP
ncbi:hypothetical protein [Hahella ganghwensis]|uniref:hypothetical protein n=1 Tax=Hahella ganghwensis TaxID=286420 RepID=UPI0003722B8A